MNRYHKYFICLLLPLFTLVGCVDDGILEEPDLDTNGELPVDFTFNWPGLSETRAFDDVNVKTRFQDGDVIHVVGTFKTQALQPDGTYVDGELSRYGALRYDSKTRQWVAVSGNQLTWPSISTSGSFYAYYVSGVNGLITQSTPIVQNLSNVTPQSDPLMAPPTGYLNYGHGVNLNFGHLCAYLTLNDLEPQVASKYFFTTDTVYTSVTDRTIKPFNNAYQISLISNPGMNADGEPDSNLVGQPALKFEFIQVPDTAYNNLVYISGNVVASVPNGSDGDEKVITKAGYFLEPGLYETFKIDYPASDSQIYEYVNYNFNNIPSSSGGVDYENRPPYLEAGTTYVLTITRSPGITIISPPSENDWDDDSEPVGNIDPEQFLQAVKNSTDYYNDENVLILEKTVEGTRLLKNISFKGFTYEKFSNLSFLPDVSESKVFDGNYHYISDLESPLFRNNYGVIKNLGLKGVSYSAVSKEYSYGDQASSQDRSRHGALCMWNRAEAQINNVKVSDVSININVEYNNEDLDGNEVHNIGCVIGSNTGKVSELYLGGSYNIKVTGSDVQNAQVLVGGVIGQIAGTGSLNDVTLLDDNFNLNIANSCKGDVGDYEVGGIVGSSTGSVSNVILSNVKIDCRQSQGLISYIGGMAGRLDIAGDNNFGYLKDCTISGEARAGITSPNIVGSGDQQYTIGGQSYIGALAGYENNVTVTGCRASVSIFGTTAGNTNVIYGTGGAFGRIQNSATIENLIAYGSQLVAPSGNGITAYTGSFAGICPANQSWQEDYANKNIIIHTFPNLPEIGMSMSN